MFLDASECNGGNKKKEVSPWHAQHTQVRTKQIHTVIDASCENYSDFFTECLGLSIGNVYILLYSSRFIKVCFVEIVNIYNHMYLFHFVEYFIIYINW